MSLEIRWNVCARAVACALPWLVACLRGEGQAEPAPGAAPAEPPPAAPVSAVSPESRRACDGICERSKQLHCAHADECRPHCLAMASATPCSTEIASFYQCLLGQPTKNWECADDGVAAIRQGFCDREQDRSVTCMEEKMR